MTKLKTQLDLWLNLKTQIVTNSKLILGQNLKIKLLQLKWLKTEQLKTQQNSKTQIAIKKSKILIVIKPKT